MNFSELLSEIRREKLVRDKVNPHFKNTYASLDAVQAVVFPILERYGYALQFSTDVETYGDEVHALLMYTLANDKGTVLVSGTYPLGLASEKPQALGSGVTYARRYVIGLLFNLTSEEDDDGNQASGIRETATTNQPTSSKLGASKGTVRKLL